MVGEKKQDKKNSFSVLSLTLTRSTFDYISRKNRYRIEETNAIVFSLILHMILGIMILTVYDIWI